MIEHLVFVRHGESRHHVEGLTGGWTDTSLTTRGRRQVQATAAHLAGMDLEAFEIFASDLARAAESAVIIGEALQREATLLPALREINNGAATGLTEAEARLIRLPEPDVPDLDWSAYEGGESLRLLEARMREALETIDAAGTTHALVVGHGFSGGVLMRMWLELPREPYIAFELGPASVSELRVNQWGERTIARMNQQLSETPP